MIAEWLWRTAFICALLWIGWELHEIRLEVQLPVEDQTTAEADADPLQESLDALRDDIAKVDAMMVAMMQLKR